MYLFKYFLAKTVGFILYRYDLTSLTTIIECFLFYFNFLAMLSFYGDDYGYNFFCLDSWQYVRTSSYTLKEVCSIDYSDPKYKHMLWDPVLKGFDIIDEKTVARKNFMTGCIIYSCFFISIASLSYLVTYH